MKTTKKRLMIDMDDVICDGGFLHLINEFTNNNYVAEDFANYYMQDVIPNDRKNEWFKFFANNNMYEHAKFIEDAFDTIEKLSQKYEVFIVTAYIIKEDISVSTRLLKDKFNWLQENLPFIDPSNYVFTNVKEIIDCDIKIDDRLSNLTGNASTNLLFTAYHNKNLTDDELNTMNAQRVNSWKEIEKILL